MKCKNGVCETPNYHKYVIKSTCVYRIKLECKIAYLPRWSVSVAEGVLKHDIAVWYWNENWEVEKWNIYVSEERWGMLDVDLKNGDM